MTSQTLALARQSRGTLLGVVGFAAALAAASHVAIPIPGTPVPVTLQPLAVALAGLWLGPAAGAASMALYLALGGIGLPVFAPVGPPGLARLLGPTGGFLLAYPVAACTAGILGRRAGGYLGRAGAAAASTAVLYLGGVAQLTVLTGEFALAVEYGVAPFVVADAVKALVAGWLAPRQTPSARG
jgi:biotin transport system substrate-specific component